MMKCTFSFVNTQKIILLSVLCSFLLSNYTSIANASNWFDSLQNTIEATKTGKTIEEAPTLEEVVSLAIDSGAQLYVIVQTAMAMDSTMAGPVIEALINVTKKPEQVVKAAIIANIELETIIRSALDSGSTVQKLVRSAINAGSDLERLITECIKTGADPKDIIITAVSVTRNAGAVVSAAVKAGTSEKDIANAVFSDANILDPTQAVSACITAKMDLNTIVREALDAGISPGLVVVVSLYTSNNYQQVINSAITWGVSKADIVALTKENLSIDHDALMAALKASETITAYTPAERRPPARNSIRTEPGNGSVSPN